MNNITGSIKLIGDTSEYGASKFRKREFVLTTPGEYPQDIKLELYQDDCNLIDQYIAGDDIEANYNVRGNEYNGKYYVNLQAWRLCASSTDKGSGDSDDAAIAPRKKAVIPKKQSSPPIGKEDLTQNISDLSDAPF
jgi:hypothetical protein